MYILYAMIKMRCPRIQTDLKVAIYELQLNYVSELNMLITVCWTSIVNVVEHVSMLRCVKNVSSHTDQTSQRADR